MAKLTEITSTLVPIEKLQPNNGQIEGLPANPRVWSEHDVERIAKSLKETPELFMYRPCIVYPLGDNFVVIGGNLRLEGARRNGDRKVPCNILPQDISIDKLKEIVIKDNGSFGAWSIKDLELDWGDKPLADWGIPNWSNEAMSEEDIDNFFEQAGSASKEKEIVISVSIPQVYSESEETIRGAIQEILNAYPGSKIK